MSIEAMLQWPVFRRHLPNLDPHISSRLGDNTFDPRLNGSEARLSDSMLRLEVVQPLVESFVANTLPCNPILDPVSLRQHVHEVAERGLTWDGQSCLLVSLKGTHP